MARRAQADEYGAPGLFAAMWRFRWLVLACVAAGVAIGLVGSSLQDTRYSATVQLLVQDPTGHDVFGTRPGTDSTSRVLEAARRMKSDEVLERASVLLDGRLTRAQLADQVSTEPATELKLINLRGRDGTARGAAEVANTVRQAYEDVVIADYAAEVQRIQADTAGYRATLEATLQSTQDQIAELRASLEREAGGATPEARASNAQRAYSADPRSRPLDIQRDSAVNSLQSLQQQEDKQRVDIESLGSGIDVVHPATAPSSPSQPLPVRNAAVAGLVGLLAGAAWAWRKADRSPKPRSTDEVAGLLGVPLLGELPGSGPRPGTRAAGREEALRAAAATTARRIESLGLHTALVVGVRGGEESTLVALHVAGRAALHGSQVLLVDADLRDRTLSGLAGPTAPTSLVALGDGAVPSVRWLEPAGSAGQVALVPAGGPAPDPSAFFASPALRRALGTLTDAADLVVLDGPGLLDSADAFELASACEGVVVVVPAGTTLEEVDDVRTRLDLAGSTVVGVVLSRSAKAGRAELQRTYAALPTAELDDRPTAPAPAGDAMGDGRPSR